MNIGVVLRPKISSFLSLLIEQISSNLLVIDIKDYGLVVLHLGIVRTNTVKKKYRLSVKSILLDK